MLSHTRVVGHGLCARTVNARAMRSTVMLDLPSYPPLSYLFLSTCICSLVQGRQRVGSAAERPLRHVPGHHLAALLT